MATTANRHYYAAYSPYGIQVVYNDFNPGTIYVFDTKHDRDRFLSFRDTDPYDLHYESVTRREAKRIADEKEWHRDMVNMLRHGSEYDRACVAGMLATPPDVLAVLAKDNYNVVREYVAANPNTPAEVLANLAKDESYSVREAAARNPNIPTDALTELAQDELKWVREAVATNPRTPADALDYLSNDESEDVCWRVAKNPNTSTGTLAELEVNENDSVREAAIKAFSKRNRAQTPSDRAAAARAVANSMSTHNEGAKSRSLSR